jgi:predicted transcriptional regulator YdeE
MTAITHKTLPEPQIVIGLQIRTSNPRELSGEGKIGALWQRFFQDNLLEQIPNRTSDSFYVVYSNYASDEYGEYDYLLGSPVSSISNLPVDMTYEAIATGEYAIITTDKGPVVQVMQDKWKEIWSMPPSELGGKRAFLTDYEIYDHRAADPTNAEVEIHLGIAPVVD